MECRSCVESVEDETSAQNCLKVKEEQNDCIIIEDSCEGTLFDTCSVDLSSDDELYGFDSPKKDKHNYILNLMKKIEFGKSEEADLERDVIDGIEFLSFASEQELMDYAKAQQDLRATSQSDDGLELLDDGNLSDISSNHAIVPTKTKDITRIKGWRNKHFAGINACDDSGSSLRNDDDGFGDDFEVGLKFNQDESSEEFESASYAASSTSKGGLECDTPHETNLKRINSPVIEDTNAIDIDERFALRMSNTNLSTSSSSGLNLQQIEINPSKSDTVDLSFDSFDIKGIFTSDSLSNIPELLDKKPLRTNSCQSYLTHLDGQDIGESKKFCKPRVKIDLIDFLNKKLGNDNFENIHEESISSLVPNSKVEGGIRWLVSSDKILSGNIYDVEAVMDSDPKTLNCKSSDSSKPTKYVGTQSCQTTSFTKGRESRIVNSNVELCHEGIAAFRSTALENYTTNLDKLHINFAIPKLDAADKVTHKEIELPVQGNNPKRDKIQKPSPTNDIRAKTVAEKRRLLSESSLNNRSKRKQMLSFKMRANNEMTNSKRVKRLRGRIEKNTKKAKLEEKIKPLHKRSHFTKSLFDENGVVRYGREKSLKCAIRKDLISSIKPNLSFDVQSFGNSPSSSNIGMILNIGVYRSLYKEASDNVERFAFDDSGNITAAYAAFSSSAVQQSFNSPFTVSRILVPVVDETLKKVMYMPRNQKSNIQISRTMTLKKKSRKGKRKIKLLSDLNPFVPQETMSKVTEYFTKHNSIENDVYNVVTKMLNYVESRECFQNIGCSYDPDVPVPVENESTVLPTLESPNRRKKTKLQIQIEKLGGTFIAVQGEDGNEEHLTQVTEENKNCAKESCRMGCVCYFRMRREEHCGREACMISCRCPPFSTRKQGCEIKSKIWLLPEVLRHHNVSQSKLAPVEREYHQTVIMSKDKQITIETKHRKRERKLPSKYKDEILFDYRKSDGLENDDCIFVTVDDEKIIPNHLENKALPDSSKKRLSNPLISFLNTTMEKPTTIHDPRFNIKQCYVQIELNEAINKMAAEKTFIPGVNIHRHKYIKSPKKVKNSRVRTRNVARKKTGCSASHSFDFENFCSRTHGVSEDYALRNILGKIRTRDLILYASVNHGGNSVFAQPNNNQPILKEDLEEMSSTDIESENEMEAHSPNEKGNSLRIESFCSLSPHNFDEQDKVDQEKTGDESHTFGRNLLQQRIPTRNNVNRQSKSTLPNGRVVYALLPKTESECRWWVVELDNEKFTQLIYNENHPERRALSFPDIRKAMFDAKYNNAPIKYALQNPTSPFQDKFGAYFVGGHKHLIFFGPYGVSEHHGITAINEKNGYVHVPFTTKFSKTEKFKSLGINMAPTKDSCLSVLKAVNAVWWYSMEKKRTISNVSEKRTVQDEQSIVNYNERNSNDDSEMSIISKEQEIEDDLQDTVGVFVDDITIEQDPLKIEPLDCYEDSISCSSGGREGTDSHTLNPINIDFSQNDPQKNTESKTDHTVPTITLRGTPDETQLIPSINGSSLLQQNLAGIKTSTSNISQSSPVKSNRAVRKKKRRKTARLTMAKKARKSNLTEKIISLKKKIGILKSVEEEMLSKKLKARKEDIEPENVSEDGFSSDSSSLSDEDMDVEILEVESDNGLAPVKEVSNVKRIVHNKMKVTSKPKESHPGNLPPCLLQKNPSEGPCPEKALLSLTPGIGYIPVKEFDPRSGNLVIEDPSTLDIEHLFLSKSQAVQWINQFFLARFNFKPKFEMQWVMMTGSIIRMLKPLNKDLFKYKAKSLTIRPCGLELGRCRLPDEDYVDWERRELSLLKSKVDTNKINYNKNTQEKIRKTIEENKDVVEYRDKSTTHNDMERIRRSELADLTTKLADLLFSKDNTTRFPKIMILNRARYACEAHKIIQEKLNEETACLKKTRDMLNQRLKGLFADILDHGEKKKALELCRFIRCNQYKVPDKSDKYLQLIIRKEQKLSAKLSGERGHRESLRPVLMSTSSSSGSLHSVISNADSVEPVRVGGSKQPTEGVLVKKNKFRSITAKRPDLRIFPASKNDEVIDLADSDDDTQVIEIESEEEDVIWLPAKEQTQTREDDDVEIISSSFKARRPKLKFPKPKRTRFQSPPRHSVINIGSTQEHGVSNKSTCATPTEQNIERTVSPNTSNPAPVAMVISPALMEQHRLAAERARLQAGPEFVSVAEHDYEPLHCEFASGCSRTDPVRDKFRGDLRRAPQQFIPLGQLVNYRNMKTSSLKEPANADSLKTVQKNSNTTKGFHQIKLKNVTTIGHISCHENLKRLKGKPVLLRKSNSGIRISKLPTTLTPIPKLTPLSATPVTITDTSGSMSVPKKLCPESANTVTLYHPVQELSVTKTVQFANLNSVKLDIPALSMLTGPKIRIPRDDTASGSLKILLPKRS